MSLHMLESTQCTCCQLVLVLIRFQPGQPALLAVKSMQRQPGCVGDWRQLSVQSNDYLYWRVAQSTDYFMITTPESYSSGYSTGSELLTHVQGGAQAQPELEAAHGAGSGAGHNPTESTISR